DTDGTVVFMVPPGRSRWRLPRLTRSPPGARIGSMSALALGLQSASGDPRPAGEAWLDRFPSSPGAWILVVLLLLVAAYFVVRLLELDLINEETPNQDDPLSRPPGPEAP